MRKKYILFLLMATAVSFGMSVSGCNQKQTAMKPANPGARGVKPAEVLSASAYRPPSRRSMPVPAPVEMAQPVYAMAPAAAPVYAAPAPAPAYTAAPGAYAPALAMAWTPELAPAPVPYAGTPQPAPVAYQPAVAQPVLLARAPIPELEPARSYRVPNRQPSVRPVAEVMMTERGGAIGSRQEVIRALTPIAPAPVATSTQKWVASPVTAMTNPRISY